MAKQPSTIGASTYQRIKRDIIFGELQPGSKLKLDALKERYSASLSTLRETLNRLASDGFVEAPEQRGFLVTPVSREDLIEISELRVLLECHALELSIENGDTDWEGNLVAAHHKLHLMEQRLLKGDDSEKETWKRYDSEFHQAMIAACNSKNLLSLHSIIYDKYLRYQMLVLTYRGEVAAKEHKHMFDAALARDANMAKKLLEDHIRNGLAHTLEAM
ncbi:MULTISPECIES: GntR family transcriptional regulator [unclassified Ruegeria]|uniref:GntR family transcriptional regulator n=1 Tax=unclassified Ruegeria TaxID=2625375 RepID=UPI00147F004A|nr:MULTISPECIES: GntR family transcriptional regulator [unclassified Ruegeria]NOD35379.1 FCD domain-containing protein [Ruegeria sp. HKCCD7296]NOD48974.1 FCD domain-containing protein [Ruegeria sp. HKCCD5849]NOD53621.1 FCD domain-containing protein [Ruegeria sp. HKCCD5851]NOD69496.1 FCD domain-containing protein [Ruegeria sp. HKCCD7303]NOE42856.1 FCD domain-containing protein [Ruegeria sp. HKCCD7319]